MYYYVYLLNSLHDSNKIYVGHTQNIKHRLNEHNTGECIHTAKYRPWQLITCISFREKEKAVAFEKYLKSGSGRSFSKRHF